MVNVTLHYNYFDLVNLEFELPHNVDACGKRSALRQYSQHNMETTHAVTGCENAPLLCPVKLTFLVPTLNLRP